MLVAKEQKHRAYSSVCVVLLVVSSNFGKSMENTEGRVGCVEESDKAKRRRFQGRNMGTLPEIFYELETPRAGDDLAGDVTERRL